MLLLMVLIGEVSYELVFRRMLAHSEILKQPEKGHLKLRTRTE
jgi:hypothetical protein